MTEAPIAIICPLAEERAALVAQMEDQHYGEIAFLPVVSGRLGGKPVLVAESGVGKVASAVIATLLAREGKARALVVSGVAGALDPKLGVGDIVIADSLLQHDYGHLHGRGLRLFRPGISPVGEPKEEAVYRLPDDLLARLRGAVRGIALPALPETILGDARARPHGERRLVFGRIASGDQFVNDEATRQRLYRELGAVAVEMEGAAAAQVGALLGIPVAVARSMSDLAGAESHLDFPRFLEAVAPAAALVVKRLVAVL